MWELYSVGAITKMRRWEVPVQSVRPLRSMWTYSLLPPKGIQVKKRQWPAYLLKYGAVDVEWMEMITRIFRPPRGERGKRMYWSTWRRFDMWLGFWNFVELACRRYTFEKTGAVEIEVVLPRQDQIKTFTFESAPATEPTRHTHILKLSHNTHSSLSRRTLSQKSKRETWNQLNCSVFSLIDQLLFLFWGAMD